MDIKPLTTLNAPAHLDSPVKIKKAAKEFEALMIGQLLRGARTGGGESGWMGTGDDQAGSAAMDMAEQELARSLASSGGLGLARMIAQGLDRAQKDAGAVTPDAPANQTPSASRTRLGSGE